MFQLPGEVWRLAAELVEVTNESVLTSLVAFAWMKVGGMEVVRVVG